MPEREDLFALLREAYVPRRVMMERCNTTVRLVAWEACQQAEHEAHSLLEAAYVLFGDPAWHELYDAGTQAWEACDA
jgi:hypothetical protein